MACASQEDSDPTTAHEYTPNFQSIFASNNNAGSTPSSNINVQNATNSISSLQITPLENPSLSPICNDANCSGRNDWRQSVPNVALQLQKQSHHFNPHADSPPIQPRAVHDQPQNQLHLQSPMQTTQLPTPPSTQARSINPLPPTQHHNYSAPPSAIATHPHLQQQLATRPQNASDPPSQACQVPSINYLPPRYLITRDTGIILGSRPMYANQNGLSSNNNIRYVNGSIPLPSHSAPPMQTHMPYQHGSGEHMRNYTQIPQAHMQLQQQQNFQTYQDYQQSQPISNCPNLNNLLDQPPQHIHRTAANTMSASTNTYPFHNTNHQPQPPSTAQHNPSAPSPPSYPVQPLPTSQCPVRIALREHVAQPIIITRPPIDPHQRRQSTVNRPRCPQQTPRLATYSRSPRHPQQTTSTPFIPPQTSMSNIDMVSEQTSALLDRTMIAHTQPSGVPPDPTNCSGQQSSHPVTLPQQQSSPSTELPHQISPQQPNQQIPVSVSSTTRPSSASVQAPESVVLHKVNKACQVDRKPLMVNRSLSASVSTEDKGCQTDLDEIEVEKEIESKIFIDRACSPIFSSMFSKKITPKRRKRKEPSSDESDNHSDGEINVTE